MLTMLRAAVSTACLLGLAGLAALPAGCANADRISISDRPWDGPEIETTTRGDQHVVKLTAPTGGWSARLDQTRRELDHTEVFITAVRPDPAFMQTQALVTHEVATGVEASRPIRVFARVLAHDETGGEYRRVRAP